MGGVRLDPIFRPLPAFCQRRAPTRFILEQLTGQGRRPFSRQGANWSANRPAFPTFPCAGGQQAQRREERCFKESAHLRVGGRRLFAGGWSAGAQAPADFYKGKTINVIVGFWPGGGYDQYARVLARHMGNHIPGNPSLVVQNAPGAGSLTAVRRTDGTLPKDGTAIDTFNPR